MSTNLLLTWLVRGLVISFVLNLSYSVARVFAAFKRMRTADVYALTFSLPMFLAYVLAGAILIAVVGVAAIRLLEYGKQ